MKIVRIKAREAPKKKRTKKQKRILSLCVFLMLAYISTFWWGPQHPYKAVAIQAVSAVWLIVIAWVNGWIRYDV